MKMRYSLKSMLAILIVGAAGAALYRSFADGAPAAYGMQDFLATPGEAAQIPAEAHSGLGSVADMLAGLERRLQAEGGDAADWLLLAKSYYHLGRQAEARQTYDRALTMGYSGDWTPSPGTDSLAAFAAETGLAHYSARTAEPAPETPGGGPPPQVRLRVSLAPELKLTLGPDTAVYLFARETEAGSAPLAVVRKKVRDLPLLISLDDSHSIMPGRTISSVERLVVGARISLSGDATRQPGDFEQLSQPLPVRSGQVVDLYIESSG